MKKILPFLLSLLICLSYITILPVFAQSESKNTVPKTITISKRTLTASYNTQTKVLTYTGKNYSQGHYGGPYEEEPALVAALITCSTDTKINREFAALAETLPTLFGSTYVFFSGIAVNDAIRSGKIKQIKIRYRPKEYDYDLGSDFNISCKNGRVSKIVHNIIDSGGDELIYSYDKNGNITSISDYYKIQHNEDQISTVIMQDPYDHSIQTITPQYDTKGNLQIQSGFQKSFHSNGTLASLTNNGKNDYPEFTATFTYMTI